MKLDRDEIRAREALEPRLKRVRGLLQMWTNFQSAKIVAEEFATNIDKMNMPLLLACTKAVIVDYYRPWSGNFNDDLESLRSGTKNNWHYPFMDSVTDTPQHLYLEELRNRLIAHAHGDYEALGVTVKGAGTQNVPQQPKTIPSVFLPIQLTLGNVRGIWWISNKDTVKEILAHIELAIAAVQEELHRTATEFRDTCIDHMHVLEKLQDIIQLDQLQFNLNQAGDKLSFDLKPYGESGNVPVTTNAPTQTQIGDQNLQSLVVVYEPDPRLPSELDKPGRGWRLEMSMKEDGSADFNVIFPIYPYPKLADQLERIVFYSNLLRDDPNSDASPETNLRGLLCNQAYFDDSEADRFVSEVKSLDKAVTERTLRDLLTAVFHPE